MNNNLDYLHLDNNNNDNDVNMLDSNLKPQNNLYFDNNNNDNSDSDVNTKFKNNLYFDNNSDLDDNKNDNSDSDVNMLYSNLKTTQCTEGDVVQFETNRFGMVVSKTETQIVIYMIDNFYLFNTKSFKSFKVVSDYPKDVFDNGNKMYCKFKQYLDFISVEKGNYSIFKYKLFQNFRLQ